MNLKEDHSVLVPTGIECLKKKGQGLMSSRYLVEFIVDDCSGIDLSTKDNVFL